MVKANSKEVLRPAPANSKTEALDITGVIPQAQAPGPSTNAGAAEQGRKGS